MATPGDNVFGDANTPRLLARYDSVGRQQHGKGAALDDLPPYSVSGGLGNPGYESQGDIPMTTLPYSSDNNNNNNNNDDDEDLQPEGCFANNVAVVQNAVINFYKENKNIIWKTIYVLLGLLYFAYFIAAVVLATKEKIADESKHFRATFLIVATVVVVGVWIYEVVAPKCRGRSSGKKTPEKVKLILQLLLCLLLLILVLVVLFHWVDVVANSWNLISAVGVAMLIALLFVFSKSPAHVRWRTVLTGLLIQFGIGVLILKTKPGFCFFRFLGSQVEIFLNYSLEGVAFVFAQGPGDFVFAFHVLSILIFFSSFVALLFHSGLMLYVIKKVSWLMGKVMGTTAAESLVATANIFVGQSEAPLMIRPFLPVMTKSELHSIMTSGFATVAGTVMGAYISFGASASHLICASIMSAPAALAMAKLFYPEKKKSKTTFKDIADMKCASPYNNALEAVSAGASDAVSLAAGIAANLIAFLSMVAFINACLTYFGNLVDLRLHLCQDLTLNLIVSWLFYPLTWAMGVEKTDLRQVSELVGVKTIVNEFVAYQNLGKLKETRREAEDTLERIKSNFTLDQIQEMAYHLECVNGKRRSLRLGGQRIPTNFISYRSEVIATYALCGFANFGSIGIQLGALAALAPDRKTDLSKVVLRAMIAGNVACFITACIAGLLYDSKFEGATTDCSNSWI